MSIGVRGNRAARSARTREGRPTKERILEAAAELFARRGFPGVSIRDITRTVGIKESSLYNHFRHKEALLEAVLDRMESEFAARAAAEEALRSRIGATTAERFMRASFGRFMEFWRDPLRISLWLVVSMEQYRNERAGRLVLDETRRVVTLAASTFATMGRMKKIRPLDPNMLAEIYAGTLRGMQLEFGILMSAGKDTSGVKRRMDRFISFFAALITAGE